MPLLFTVFPTRNGGPGYCQSPNPPPSSRFRGCPVCAGRLGGDLLARAPDFLVRCGGCLYETKPRKEGLGGLDALDPACIVMIGIAWDFMVCNIKMLFKGGCHAENPIKFHVLRALTGRNDTINMDLILQLYYIWYICCRKNLSHKFPKKFALRPYTGKSGPDKPPIWCESGDSSGKSPRPAKGCAGQTCPSHEIPQGVRAVHPIEA